MNNSMQTHFRTFEHTISFVMLCCILNPCGPLVFPSKMPTSLSIGCLPTRGEVCWLSGPQSSCLASVFISCWGTVSVSDLPLYKIINKANMICIM